MVRNYLICDYFKNNVKTTEPTLLIMSSAPKIFSSSPALASSLVITFNVESISTGTFYRRARDCTRC